MTNGYDIKQNADTTHVKVVKKQQDPSRDKEYNNVAMSHGYNVNKNMHDSYSHI